MNKAAYAEAGTGVRASQIGWFNYSGLDKLNVNSPIIGIENELKCGYTISFDLLLEEEPNENNPFQFRIHPLYAQVAFGNTAYLDINEPVVLYPENYPDPSSVETQWTITMSNIIVRDNLGRKVTNYAIVVADAEENNKGESWGVVTNGNPWVKLETMPSVGGKTFPVVIQGRGTNTINTFGTRYGNVPALVFLTENPTEVKSILQSRLGKQGVAFGAIVLTNDYLICSNCITQI